MHPVIGAPRPYVSRTLRALTGDPVADFAEFETATVRGLMRVLGDTLDVLSIGAKRPGRGDGARFISAAMKHYARIRFLHVMNVEFGAMLERNGFVKGVLYEHGELIATFEWTRTTRAPG